MPKFQIEDPKSGASLVIEADRQPSPEDIDYIFAQSQKSGAQKETAQAKALDFDPGSKPVPSLKLNAYEQAQMKSGGKVVEPPAIDVPGLVSQVQGAVAPVGKALDFAGKAMVGQIQDFLDKLINPRGDKLTGEDLQAIAESEKSGKALPATVQEKLKDTNIQALLKQTFPSVAKAYGEQPPAQLPYEEATGRLPGVPRAIAKTAQGLVASAPQMALAAAQPELGALSFGITPEGFDPAAAAVAMVAPWADKYGGALAENVASKLGVNSNIAKALINRVGGAGSAAGLIGADQARRIRELPADQQADALVDAAGNAIAMFAMALPGERHQLQSQVKREAQQVRANAAPATATALEQSAQPTAQPQPKENADAVQSKAAQPVRTVQSQPGKGEGQVPAAGGGAQNGQGGGEAPQGQKVDASKPLLVAAAVKDPKTGKWFQGPHHPAVEAHLGMPETTREQRNNENYGFVVRMPDGSTDIAGREEATKIAKENGQALENYDDKTQLHSDMAVSPWDASKTISESDIPVQKAEGQAGKSVTGVTPEQRAQSFWEGGTDHARRKWLGERDQPTNREWSQLSPEEQATVTKAVGVSEESVRKPITDEQAEQAKTEQKQRATQAEQATGGRVAADEYESLEREGMGAGEETGTPVRMVEAFEGESADEPFAGTIARPNSKGEIEVKSSELAKALARVPAERRQAYMRSLVAEEANHIATKKAVGNEGAAKFWRSMTKLEQALHFRRYTGEWNQEALSRNYPGAPRFSDSQLGHEAINSFMMRAANMPLREFVEATGKERWKVGTYDKLARIVHDVRSKLGTKASAEQLALLDNIQKNLAAARAAAAARPQAHDLLDMSPEDLAKWKKEAQYSPELMKDMAATVQPEELPLFMSERDRLRQEISQDMAHATPETVSAAWAANANKSLKAQTLNEMVEHAPKPEPQPEQPSAAQPQQPEYPAAFQKQLDEQVNNPAHWQKTSDIPDELRDKMWPVVRGILQYQRGEELPSQPTNRDVHDMLDLFARTSEDSPMWRQLPPETQQQLKDWFSHMEGTGEGRNDRLRNQIATHEHLADMFEQQGYERQASDERQWAEATRDQMHSANAQAFPAAFNKKAEEMAGDPNEKRALFVLNSMRGKSIDAIAQELGTTPEGVAKALETLRQRGDVVSYKGRGEAYGEPNDYLWMLSKPKETRAGRSQKELGQTSLFGAMPRRGSEEQAQERRAGPGVDINPPTEEEVKGNLPTPEQVAEVMQQFYPPATANDIENEAKRVLFEDRMPPQAQNPQAKKGLSAEEQYAKSKVGSLGLAVPTSSGGRPALPEMPSFEDFLKSAQDKWGPMVQPGQLLDIWNDQVAKLATAPGKDLERMRKVLRLENNFGNHKIADPLPEQAAAAGREFQLQGEQMNLPTAEAREEERATAARRKKLETAGQRYRALIFSAISKKLTPEASTPFGKNVTKPLDRKAIDLDDIGWHRGLPHEVWTELSAEDNKNPETLGKELVAGARVKNKKVSITKRVVFFLNQRDGTVHAVSTFEDGRRGVVVTDPRAPGKIKPNVPLESVLRDPGNQFRAIYAMTLDEPVQDFHQSWKSLREFNKRFGRPANQIAQQMKGRILDYARAAGLTGDVKPESTLEGGRGFGIFNREQEGEAPVGMRLGDAAAEDELSPARDPEAADYEGLPHVQVSKGSGGSVMGPGAGTFRGEMLEEQGTFERGERTPLSRDEATSVLNHIMDELGDLKSPEDVQTIIDQLRDEPKTRNWRLISGLQKMFNYLQDAEEAYGEELKSQGVKDFVPRSPSELLKMLPDYIYNTWKESRGGDDFADRMLHNDTLRFEDQKKEVLPQPKVPDTGARDLVAYRRGEVLSKRSAKAFRQPERIVGQLPTSPSQPGRIPPGNPGALPVKPTEMLSEREQRHLSGRIKYAELRERALGSPAAEQRLMNYRNRLRAEQAAGRARVTSPMQLPQLRQIGDKGKAYPAVKEGQNMPFFKDDLFSAAKGDPSREVQLPRRPEDQLRLSEKGPARNIDLPRDPKQEGLFTQKKSELKPDEPAAFQKVLDHPAYKKVQEKKDEAMDTFGKLREVGKAWLQRREVRADIYRTADGADNAADSVTLQAGNSIRLASMNDIDERLATTRKSPLTDLYGSFKDIVQRSQQLRDAEKQAFVVRCAAKALLAARSEARNELFKMKPMEKKEFADLMKSVSYMTDNHPDVEDALSNAKQRIMQLGDITQEDLEKKAKKDPEYKEVRKRVYEQYKHEYVPKTLRSIHLDAMKDPEVTQFMMDNPYDTEGAEELIKQKSDAMIPVEASHFDPLLRQCDTGIGHATQMLKSTNPGDRLTARKWLKAAQDLKAEVEYAKAHFQDEDMQNTVAAFGREMEAHRKFMNENGFNLAERKDMVPGRYSGEVWDGDTLRFAGRTIGSRHYLPKTFSHYYEAIAAGPYFSSDSTSTAKKRSGPYIPVNRDIADLAQNSILHGLRAVNRTDWIDMFRGVKDPHSGKPIVIDPVKGQRYERIEDPETGEMELHKKATWKSKSPEYVVLDNIARFGKPAVVHVGYVDYFREAMADSAVPTFSLGKIPVGQAALTVSSALKHGVVLILDTFHPGRLYQYGIALGGSKWHSPGVVDSGWRRGLSALTYRPEDLDKAVRVGLVSPKAAAWAQERIPYRLGNRVQQMRRGDIAQMMVSQGLNASKMADTLYKDAVQKIPLIGEEWHELLKGPNKWIFDKITPGLMVESAVRNYERTMQENPNLNSDKVLKDVINDINVMFGNMGRQGVFSNPTFRDMAQITLLAPLWREGLFQKDIRTLSRMGALPLAGARSALENFGGETGRRLASSKAFDYRRGLPPMGTLGRAMLRGMAAYFVTAQVANLICRQRFTWQNPEQGHKLDAIIPMGDHEIALPTMSVFGEVLHDMVRLVDRRGTFMDALGDMGANALGPIGQSIRALTFGTKPTGEKITSSPGRLLEAGKALAPAPISVGGWVRQGLHALAPNTVSPLKPGESEKRLLGMVGIKVNKVESARAQMNNLAQAFMKENQYNTQSGWQESQTDEPSYAKFRTALANHDTPTAKEIYEQLKVRGGKDADNVSRNVDKLARNMRDWSRRPFTGSSRHEGLFYDSLNDEQKKIYEKAMEEKQLLYTTFAEQFMSQFGD